MPQYPTVSKVSYSSKSQYEWCPRQYRYDRVDRVKPDFPPRISTIVGKAIHALINRMYRDENFSLDYLLGLWSECFYYHIKEDGFKFPNKQTETRWLNIGEEIIRKFHAMAQERGMLVKPLKTEWRGNLIVTAKSGRQYKINFVIDLLIQVGDEIWLPDFKSGSFRLSQPEIDESDQLTIYSMGIRRVLGITEDKLGFFYLRYGTVVWTSRPRTEEDFEKLIESIDATWTKIEAKQFEPTYDRCHLCPFSRRCSAEDLAKKSGLHFDWLYGEPK